MLIIDVATTNIGEKKPWDYGRKDWHHNEEGDVDYPGYIDSNNPIIPTGKYTSRESQRYNEILAEEAQYENLRLGAQKRWGRWEGIREYERWLEEWN